jgi:kinetochore protein Nuf2
MASGFGFPMLSSAEIAESVVQFGIAPVANLRPEDIAKPQPDLLPAILARFLASFVDAPG